MSLPLCFPLAFPGVLYRGYGRCPAGRQQKLGVPGKELIFQDSSQAVGFFAPAEGLGEGRAGRQDSPEKGLIRENLQRRQRRVLPGPQAILPRCNPGSGLLACRGRTPRGGRRHRHNGVYKPAPGRRRQRRQCAAPRPAIAKGKWDLNRLNQRRLQAACPFSRTVRCAQKQAALRLFAGSGKALDRTLGSFLKADVRQVLRVEIFLASCGDPIEPRPD